MANQPRNEHTVNLESLSRILGVTAATVRTWEGFSDFPPFRKGSRGVSGAYDSVKVIRWWARKFGPEKETQTSVDQLEADRRKTVAQAELAELHVLAKRGEMVDAEEMRAATGKAFANVKTRVLGVASTLAPQLAQANEPTRVQSILYDALASALADLAGNVIDERNADSEPVEPDAGPTPQADRGRVGRKRKGAKPRVKRRARALAK